MKELKTLCRESFLKSQLLTALLPDDVSDATLVCLLLYAPDLFSDPPTPIEILKQWPITCFHLTNRMNIDIFKTQLTNQDNLTPLLSHLTRQHDMTILKNYLTNDQNEYFWVYAKSGLTTSQIYVWQTATVLLRQILLDRTHETAGYRVEMNLYDKMCWLGYGRKDVPPILVSDIKRDLAFTFGDNLDVGYFWKIWYSYFSRRILRRLSEGPYNPKQHHDDHLIKNGPIALYAHILREFYSIVPYTGMTTNLAELYLEKLSNQLKQASDPVEFLTLSDIVYSDKVIYDKGISTFLQTVGPAHYTIKLTLQQNDPMCPLEAEELTFYFTVLEIFQILVYLRVMKGNLEPDTIAHRSDFYLLEQKSNLIPLITTSTVSGFALGGGIIALFQYLNNKTQ